MFFFFFKKEARKENHIKQTVKLYSVVKKTLRFLSLYTLWVDIASLPTRP